ncbi:hypothetical protein BV20DRAFT_1021606 [Pilatotrama ljubarskyi]|nr:hypothetical protein BV20DRAFT_1021606 [Pilatotrama ljubarskyi]
MRKPSSSSTASESSSTTNATFIENLDLDILRTLALQVHATARQGLPQPSADIDVGASPSDVSCAVISPPRSGSSNVVYDLEFSDGLSWIFRVPFEEWGPVEARSMQLDIIAVEFIASRTSLPIPSLHAYSCTSDNPLGHPYMIMDKVHGICLSDVWNDPSWWNAERRKEDVFQSLAGYMTQLAGLEFDKIGRLDRVGPDGPYVVVPFPSEDDPDEPREAHGPFDSTQAYLSALLAERRETETDAYGLAQCALLQMFIGAVPEPRYARAPFALGHPDYNAQNIFVDDTGKVVGLIDWDGVCIEPRQLGALGYPIFLTLDWTPALYHADQDKMHRYRQMYTEAIRVASGGKLDAVVRNSHILQKLCIAASTSFGTQSTVIRLSEYVFGSRDLMRDVLEGLEHGSWLTSLPDEIAVVAVWPEPVDDRSVNASDASQSPPNDKSKKSGKDGGWMQKLSGWLRRKLSTAVQSWTRR